jgi:hypothetical protein
VSPAISAGDGAALRAQAFGLRLRFDEIPPGAWTGEPRAGAGEPSLEIRLASEAAIATSWSGAAAIAWEADIDGARFVVERGRTGDHRFGHGSRSLHHLSADGSQLLRWTFPGQGPAGWRTCLDSVLFCASLLNGYEALHAAAVASERGAICITAAAGGGKSTLLAALLRSGCAMVADDVTTLEPRSGDVPLAHPGPPLMTVADGLAPLPGTEIAKVGEELWLGVPVHGGPLPLAALVVLDRRPGLVTSLRRVPNPLADLMRGLLRFPRTTAREGARFELAAAIASEVPIWCLQADPAVTPEVLASIVREST